MLNGLDLFSGIGGITRALEKWVRPIAYCEIDPYCQSLLLQRMQKKNLPQAPIWDDVCTLSTKGLPQIDIIYGGFPCQDISIAKHGEGLDGKQSSLVFRIFRLLDETQSPFLFLENVPNIRSKGAERICKELAKRGHDCRWCCISASDVGAPHKRERWFLLAHAEGKRRKERGLPIREKKKHSLSSIFCSDQITPVYWETPPPLGRVVDGLPYRVDRIKALGNAVVPLQVKTAFNYLLTMKDLK